MLETGTLIDGKYRVVRLLGKGGMGAVYEGHHMLIERRVAIKVLFAHVAESESGVARFEREVRAAGRIGNDHILEISDVGVLPDGSRYMVSEYLDGETLASRIERVGRLTPDAAAPLVIQLLTGLAAAHQVGILHRDLKPDNVFLLREKAGRADFVKLIDFGIAKFQAAEESLKMTSTGMVVGTPYYLSPEQAQGTRQVDARSDVYAIGVILYECVTGRVPFKADSFSQLLFKIALEDAPPVQQLLPGIDPNFSAIIQRAMARVPEQRYQSALALREELLQWVAVRAPNSSDPELSNTMTVMARPPTPNGTPWPAPTPSSFGRSAERFELSGEGAPAKSRIGLVVALVGVGLAVVLGVGWRLIRGSSTSADVAAASASVSNATAAPLTAPVAAPPVVTPAPPTVVAAPDVFVAPEPVENTARRPPTPSVARPTRTPTNRAAAAPSRSTAAPATAAAAPPPPPAAEPKRPAANEPKSNRDFGY